MSGGVDALSPFIHPRSSENNNNNQLDQRRRRRRRQQQQSSCLSNHSVQGCSVLSPPSSSIDSRQQNTSNDIMALHMHPMAQRSSVHMFNLTHPYQHSLNCSVS